LQLSRSRFAPPGGSAFAPALHGLAAATALTIAACAATNRASDEAVPDVVVETSIEQVIQRRAPEVMRIEGVQGLGQGICDGRPCIRVYILSEAVAARLPASLDGYVVDPLVTGVIRPRSDP
jgi:hypothetical protein